MKLLRQLRIARYRLHASMRPTVTPLRPLTYVKGSRLARANLSCKFSQQEIMSMSMELPTMPDGPPSFFASALEYMVDAGQRSVLFLDVMRRRGVQYREHLAETVPHVLDYGIELIVDGRTLERPVNYGLVRITPPKGVEIDLKRRPFVVVDHIL